MPTVVRALTGTQHRIGDVLLGIMQTGTVDGQAVVRVQVRTEDGSYLEIPLGQSVPLGAGVLTATDIGLPTEAVRGWAMLMWTSQQERNSFWD